MESITSFRLFYSLIDKLRTAGFTVTLKEEIFAIVEGKGIKGGFCETNDDCYWYINGRIAFDNVRCFDKWSKCPVSLALPTNDNEFNFLLKQLEFWGSDKGFQKSNTYDYVTVNDYNL